MVNLTFFCSDREVGASAKEKIIVLGCGDRVTKSQLFSEMVNVPGGLLISDLLAPPNQYEQPR